MLQTTAKDLILPPDARKRPWRVAAACLGVLVAAIGTVRSGSSEPVDGVASTLETTIPWTPVHSIWFFSNRAEIDRLETAKFVALADWVDTHAGSEVGISLPSAATEPESAQARTDQLRIAAIREAMVAAGIPTSRIHVGAYGGLVSAVDRRVVIYVRAGTGADAPDTKE